MLRTPHSKRAFHPGSGRKAHVPLDEVGGGPEGTRTPDLLHAMQTRSQLRHRPMYVYAYLAAAPGWPSCAGLAMIVQGGARAQGAMTAQRFRGGVLEWHLGSRSAQGAIRC